MNEKLQKMTEQWMKLERKTLAQREKAEQFYEEKMMSGITAEYVANNQGIIEDQVKYLIVSVGTSYEPIVLNISLLKPERIHFLYTEQSETVIDKVANFCGLKFSQVEKSKVVETETIDVYREIKDCYMKWNKPEKMYIDFTGGTKAMSTAAAMAGSLINVQMIYCGTNQYMKDFRKPYPGSERLFLITNPMSVFGDLEIDKAYALFEEHNYAAVSEKLGGLKDEVPNPSVRQDLSHLYILARTYEAWDALDFMEAYKYMCALTHDIHRDLGHENKFALAGQYQKLKRQERILRSLNELQGLVKERKQIDILEGQQFIYPLMFTLYQSALVREQQEKYDMSTLLFYRILEMIEQRRLIQYKLYVSKMDYTNMTLPGEDVQDTAQLMEYLKNKVFSIKKSLFGKCSSNYLPDQVSLLEGFIILSALGDELLGDEKGGLAKLSRIRAMVSLRNNSIFAHGLVPVRTGDYMKFKSFVEELFKEICDLEGINFDAYMDDISWICPSEKTSK